MAPYFLQSKPLLLAASQARKAYASASPFCHAVVDDWLPSDIVSEASRTFPGPDHPGFRRRDYDEQRGRFGQLQRREFAGVNPCIRQLLNEVNSMVFLKFLQRLTGVPGLIPDPFFSGAGLHLTEPGGHLALHADFDRDRTRGLARRLSIVLFLVERWKESWGGHLELWDKELSQCEVRIVPAPGRLVVFEHGDEHWHGHPQPLASPAGVGRQTLAASYYVADGQPQAEGHSAIWAQMVRG